MLIHKQGLSHKRTRSAKPCSRTEQLRTLQKLKQACEAGACAGETGQKKMESRWGTGLPEHSQAVCHYSEATRAEFRSKGE